jgi:hypothetical protein
MRGRGSDDRVPTTSAGARGGGQIMGRLHKLNSTVLADKSNDSHPCPGAYRGSLGLGAGYELSLRR